MALFGKKLIACPICGEGLPARANKLMHYTTHAILTEAGDYGWQCPCGEADGYWTEANDAAVGMAKHFDRSHGISVSTTLGQ